MKKNKVSIYSIEFDLPLKRSDAHAWMFTNRYTGTHNHDFFSGLIIDSFGELRDQQEQVKEDMEVRFDTQTLSVAPQTLQKSRHLTDELFCVYSF